MSEMKIPECMRLRREKDEAFQQGQQVYYDLLRAEGRVTEAEQQNWPVANIKDKPWHSIYQPDQQEAGACKACGGRGFRVIPGTPGFPLCDICNGTGKAQQQEAGYRLLTRADTIQSTDELLRDDCVTWEPVANQLGKGFAYDPGFYVPVRRTVESAGTGKAQQGEGDNRG